MNTNLIWLIVFAALLLSAFIGFALIVLKKQVKLIPVVALILGISLVGGGYNAFKLTKKAVEKAKHAEVIKVIENAGEKIGEVGGAAANGVAKGVNKQLEAATIEAVSKKIGIGISTTLSTIGTAINKDFGDKPVYVSKALEKKGFKIASASFINNEQFVQLSIGVSSAVAVVENLRAIAYNGKNELLATETLKMVESDKLNMYNALFAAIALRDIAYVIISAE